MKTFSYIALSLTLALAFCLWLPNNLSFTILWMGTAFLSLPLLIADVIALIYLIRHRKENCVKGLVAQLVLIPVVFAIGMYAPWHSASDKTMFNHYHRHENDLRELIQYAESLTDSVSVSFPSDSIPKEVSREQYEHVLQLLWSCSVIQDSLQMGICFFPAMKSRCFDGTRQDLTSMEFTISILPLSSVRLNCLVSNVISFCFIHYTNGNG